MFGHIRQWLAGTHRHHVRSPLALRCESLEDRTTPSGLFVAGVGGITQAVDPEVSLYATVGPWANARLNAFQAEAFSGTAGDTRVAVGDVNADGTDDLIAAAGFGAQADVAVFDGASALKGTSQLMGRFTAYDNFQGGVFVAAGDLDHDGRAEIVVTPGLGGRGHLKVFAFNEATNAALGGSTLMTSVYTFAEYNGEVRVATLKAEGDVYVVTASGAGVAGDVRAFRNAHLIPPPPTPDAPPDFSKYLAARLVPFGGYSGGLSIAAGDTDGDGNDELFVAKNDGAPYIEIYDAVHLREAYLKWNFSPAPDALVNRVFDGFLGPIRLGASDVDGDGKVEVLATTGWSGDPQGTPVKAFSSTNNFVGPVQSFYSNPGYLPGAWLAGKDFTFAQDVTSTKGLSIGVGGGVALSPLPVRFGNGLIGLIPFPDSGAKGLPSETVTGAALPFHNAEVSFAFTHTRLTDVDVDLMYGFTDGSPAKKLRLVTGANFILLPAGYDVTITDDADRILDANVPSVANESITGRFLPIGGSLHDFIAGLDGKPGGFALVFTDNFGNQLTGILLPSPAPHVRLLY